MIKSEMKKKVVTCFLLGAVLATVLFMTGCGGNNDLVGPWVFQDDGSTLTLHDDMSFQWYFSGHGSLRGVWDSSRGTLTLSFDDGEESAFSYELIEPYVRLEWSEHGLSQVRRMRRR